jgi:hypothetical protein
MVVVEFARVPAPKSQPAAVERERQLCLVFCRRRFRRHLRLEGKPGNEIRIVKNDLHVEHALFKFRGKNHHSADGLRLTKPLDLSQLLRQPLEERTRFVQRQRGVHLLAEFGLDTGIIARVDQLDELVGHFRGTIRPLSRCRLGGENRYRENHNDRQNARMAKAFQERSAGFVKFGKVLAALPAALRSR